MKFLSLAVAVLLAFSGVATAQITVSGEGSAKAVPDVAYVSVAVSNHADTAKKAAADNAIAQDAVFKALKKAGLKDSEMMTSGLSLHPVVIYNKDGTETPNGFNCINELGLTICDITKVGDVIDAAVGAGANRVQNISFAVSKTEALLDTARAAAAKDAKRKAGILAQALGVTLGDAITVEETQSYSRVQYSESARMDMAPGAKTAVAAGEKTLKVGVRVVFKIGGGGAMLHPRPQQQ